MIENKKKSCEFVFILLQFFQLCDLVIASKSRIKSAFTVTLHIAGKFARNFRLRAELSR